MIYYLDCEFDGYRGDLISIGLAAWDHRTFYAVVDLYAYGPNMQTRQVTNWVYDNVIPVLWPAPTFNVPGSQVWKSIDREKLSLALEQFLKDDMEIHVIADWPDDLKYFCELLTTGPGTMINIPNLALGVARVDAYPSTISDTVQHNAMWDAIALAEHLQPGYVKGPVL